MPIRIKRFGWTPDLPDSRDHAFTPDPAVAASPSASVDLRPGCPPVYNQGSIGACTANAIAAAVDFERRRDKMADPFQPSRLFIYYNERDLNGQSAFDCGAQIRDGIKTIAALGVCPEDQWPYDETKFAVRPDDDCYAVGKRHPAVSYSRVDQTVDALKACLASGYPFVFGLSAYESFESPEVARTGSLDLPAPGEAPVGGHAVMAVGYNDASQRFLIRNSWGVEWGMFGHFAVPYAYLADSNLAADFWIIRVVS